jgi:2-dehydro-3-deoxygalactonokinase
MNSPGSTEELCAIYVDMGTTNTRVWLVRGNEILARGSKTVGVGDTARDGSTTRIQSGLKELITAVLTETNYTSKTRTHLSVVAAGMIGSPLGLAEVTHVSAPAGVREIADASRWFHFPQITDLPFLLVPGVCSGPTAVDSDALPDLDVMRGEETLCIGLTELGLVRPPAVILNLGSHWKAIQLATDGRVQLSVTSLSGELIHAAQRQTVLASSVSKEWPAKISEQWMEEGMKEQRRSGLPRALFSVRLLELTGKGTEEDRFSFLVGAFVAADLDALVARGILVENIPVVISGNEALADAWAEALQKRLVPAKVLTTDETEKAFLAGLRLILRQVVARNHGDSAAVSRTIDIALPLNVGTEER